MMKGFEKMVFCLLTVVLLCMGPGAMAAEETEKQEQPKGPPPTLVVTAEITTGNVEPQQEYVGTVYFSRVSRVASEVEGLVEQVTFEEGDTIENGKPLVVLSASMLAASIDSTRAAYEQALVEQEQAEKNLKRIDPLYKEESVSEKVYDEYYYTVKSQEKRAASLKATMDRLLLEKEKKTIRAPFYGIIMDKQVEKGEWVSVGGTVAQLADNREIDVVIDVPATMLEYLEKDREVAISSNGEMLTGRFINFAPKGDVATRTFSIKIRLKNTAGLIEGMEARAVLPVDGKKTGLIVPRDAVINKFGQNVLFLSENSAAKMVPVEITGYDGLLAGISGPGLAAGQAVVVKGNERLRDGQPLTTAE